MGSALRSVGEIGKEVGQQLIEGDDATRFLVVRHPLFRFYSGFRQKFKKADPLHVKLLKKSGYLRERNQAHVESTDDDMTITFADFGHFIGSMIPKSSTFNSHFRPQFHACQACNYKFDNIIKTEFMNEEANYVLRKAGYDIMPWDGFVQRGSTVGGISKEIRSDKLKEQLSTLSREDLTGLVKRYEMDLAAFGYTVDVENNLLGGWND